MKSFFIHYKNPLTVLIVLAIMGGLYVYSKLPMALFPEITFPKIKNRASHK
jgi:multidrug efflux pump subunit AcrB